MSKRKLDDEGTVYGYIHSTSNVKQAMHSTTRYFDGTIQTSDTEFMRYVSFPPEKINSFQSAQALKTPIKITNSKLTPKAGNKELTIGKYSAVEVVKKLDFTMKSEVKKQPSPSLKVHELTKPNMMCTISVKIIGFWDQEEVKHTKYGPKRMRTTIISDETGIIKMPLWEESIGKVTTGQSYKITHVVTSSFHNQIHVSTTASSTFELSEEIKDAKEDITDLIKTNTFLGTVHACNLKKDLSCLNCNKKIAMDTNPPAIIRCNSCASKQKLQNIPTKRILSLQVQSTDGQMKKFIVFSPHVENFIDKNNLNGKTDAEVEDFLLLKDKIQIKHDPDSDIVSSLD